MRLPVFWMHCIRSQLHESHINLGKPIPLCLANKAIYLSHFVETIQNDVTHIPSLHRHVRLGHKVGVNASLGLPKRFAIKSSSSWKTTSQIQTHETVLET